MQKYGLIQKAEVFPEPCLWIGVLLFFSFGSIEFLKVAKSPKAFPISFDNCKPFAFLNCFWFPTACDSFDV